jgi:hypothetical protein
LFSGISGQNITLSSSDLPGFTVIILDETTIFASSAWDGNLTSPILGNDSGTAPNGYDIGNYSIDLGSSLGIMMFDKPVTIILTNMTGEFAYKPSGSTSWMKINETCSDYDSPNNPTFPRECIIDNGTDTKIVTYHFTTFSDIVTTTTTSSTTTTRRSGGGGGGSSPWNPATTTTISISTSTSSTTSTTINDNNAKGVSAFGIIDSIRSFYAGSKDLSAFEIIDMIRVYYGGSQ